ncbi:GTP cyclohydrolase I [Micromonospora schwarzwaldensis]|uniref:GTP cyclohydrolase I n=1 Tax=Micromonospora sp. DSM 45708 TaxID=3111767 RepID=UPI0031E16E02
MTTTLPGLNASAQTAPSGADAFDQQQVRLAVTHLLQALGVPGDSEVARNTPRRVTDALTQLLTPEPLAFTTFLNDDSHHDLVLVREIPFTSLCAHHLLPFYGHAHVGFYPKERLPGLSKIARAVAAFAARLQIQESLGQQVATYLETQLGCDDVGVVLVAEHLCMTRRGARAAGTNAVTIATRGRLARDQAVRSEFLCLAMPSARDS